MLNAFPSETLLLLCVCESERSLYQPGAPYFSTFTQFAWLCAIDSLYIYLHPVCSSIIVHRKCTPYNRAKRPQLCMLCYLYTWFFHRYIKGYRLEDSYTCRWREQHIWRRGVSLAQDPRTEEARTRHCQVCQQSHYNCCHGAKRRFDLCHLEVVQVPDKSSNWHWHSSQQREIPVLFEPEARISTNRGFLHVHWFWGERVRYILIIKYIMKVFSILSAREWFNIVNCEV